MGRFLAASIPTQLFIKRRGESFNNLDLIKDKEKILNQINKYIDLSFYDINKEENQIYLKLKEVKANKYLKEFFKEIESILELNHYLQFSLFKEEDTNEGFDLRNILKKNETKKEINFDNIVIKKDIKENDINYYMTAGEKNHEINEDLSCIDGAPWIFDFTKEFRSIINGNIEKPSSVALFNWISYTQKSLKQKEVPMTDVKLPEFIKALPY